MRRGEPHAFEAVDVAAGAQQFGERAAVAGLIRIGEGHPVGVDVLAEQGHLEHTGVDERLDLGEDVARATVDLFAAQRRDDTERAGVVAADRHRHPAGVGGVTLGRQGRRERFEGVADLDLCRLVVAGPVEQGRQRTDVVRAEHHVHPRGATEDDVLVLLGEAAADGDLHAGAALLDRGEVREVAVQLVVGVLADGAGVEHDQVRVVVGVGPHVPGVFEETRDALGIVHVHLAAVGSDLITAHRAGALVGADSRLGQGDAHIDPGYVAYANRLVGSPHAPIRLHRRKSACR